MEKQFEEMPLIQMPTQGVWRWHWVETLVKKYGWKVGCELGVKEGRFTWHLLGECPELYMHAVDLWDTQLGNDTKVGGETYETWDNKAYRDNFKKTMRYHCRDRVSIYEMMTSAAGEIIQDDSLDFVFIDADHSFEGVDADINTYMSKVKSDGAILGHDFSWPTVQKAIAKNFGRNPKIFLGANNCWGIWKKDI